MLSHLLAPIDVLTAAIYSILIVLTLTLAFSVVKRTSGYGVPMPDDFGTELFLSVLGATVAWGLIEGLTLVLLAAGVILMAIAIPLGG